uniref:Uncharacterized protein n=1 Tax=Rhizophora mucronata TaxID=61149 RepID=A0A2P2QPX9_RHIMU
MHLLIIRICSWSNLIVVPFQSIVTRLKPF